MHGYQQSNLQLLAFSTKYLLIICRGQGHFKGQYLIIMYAPEMLFPLEHEYKLSSVIYEQVMTKWLKLVCGSTVLQTTMSSKVKQAKADFC